MEAIVACVQETAGAFERMEMTVIDRMDELAIRIAKLQEKTGKVKKQKLMAISSATAATTTVPNKLAPVSLPRPPPVATSPRTNSLSAMLGTSSPGSARRKKQLAISVATGREHDGSPRTIYANNRQNSASDLLAITAEMKTCEMPEQLIKDALQEGEVIGEGAFGTVYRCKLYGTKVAVKVIRTSSSRSSWMTQNPTPKSRNEMEEFAKEVKILSTLRHRNIVLFMGYLICPDWPQIAIVTEYCSCTLLLSKPVICHSLNDVLIAIQDEDKKTAFWRDFCRIAADITKGMNWLHSNNIFHGDLSVSNLLIVGDGTIKISDFGMSNALSLVGDADKQGLPAIDVFDFGVVLWQLKTLTVLDKEKKPRESRICFEDMPAIPDDCEPWLSSIISDCWAQERKDRPSFSLLLQLFSRQKSPTPPMSPFVWYSQPPSSPFQRRSPMSAMSYSDLADGSMHSAFADLFHPRAAAFQSSEWRNSFPMPSSGGSISASNSTNSSYNASPRCGTPPAIAILTNISKLSPSNSSSIAAAATTTGTTPLASTTTTATAFPSVVEPFISAKEPSTSLSDI